MLGEELRPGGRLERGLGSRELHVLLTIHWHARSAADVARRFPEARLWAHSRNHAAVARRAPVTNVFRLGDELPTGLVALEARPRSEVLLWEPRSQALIAGDALLGDGERARASTPARPAGCRSRPTSMTCARRSARSSTFRLSSSCLPTAPPCSAEPRPR
jgi:glyoxylase-like metal-dependent hydrolase (beta-lactamase superfamily II)